ncbi:MAG: hypothetical protein LC808_41040, partial [Actinobacteria bacterium]|nr:hypothetical protein [Actinomycetota bacterium]
YGLFFNEAYINVQEARSLTILGKHRLAAGKLRESITLLPPVYRRDSGVYLSWSAHAYLGSRDLDQAVSLGGQALAIARETGSGRIAVELARLRDALPERRTSPQVRELRQAITDCIRNCDNSAGSSPMNREKIK